MLPEESQLQKKNRVLLAMSGGIDSSVSAILLLEQGYEVIGVTFRVFDSIRQSCFQKEKGCCSIDSIMEAKHLAQQLGITHHIVDYRAVFKKQVINNFISEYMTARTPNPCVLCNYYIKWGAMFDLANELECQYIATGHYAQIEKKDDLFYLKTAVDTTKDQTYFLWMLPQDKLQRTLFPLGNLTKSQVRNLATQHGFPQLNQKKESQEICFIPNNDYRSFLSSQGCKNSPGEFIDTKGNTVGKHNGYHLFTIGQRKGLGIALGFPCFVKKINAKTNQVTVSRHDDLYTSQIIVSSFRCVSNEKIFVALNLKIRIRYRSPLIQAKVTCLSQTKVLVNTAVPVWGVTPGQSLVFYDDNLLIGGGFIDVEE